MRARSLLLFLALLLIAAPEVIGQGSDPTMPQQTHKTGTYQAGEPVEIEWHGSWYRGRVLETEADRYKVHYDGYGDDWDEWVVGERLRRVGVTEGETGGEIAGAPTPSGAAALTGSAPAAGCASTGAARLQLEEARYAPNEPMRIGFAHPKPQYMDNVEVHRIFQGGSEMVRGSFVWGEAEGTAEIPAPGAPGAYEARYVSAGDGEVLACVPFEVGAARHEAPSTATGTVSEGIYETYFHGYDGLLNKWLAGDIEILAGGRYTFQGEAGRYGYDPGSGRIVWSGGGLDGVYAVVRESGGRPAIVIPREENRAAGRDLAVSDVWGYLRH